MDIHSLCRNYIKLWKWRPCDRIISYTKTAEGLIYCFRITYFCCGSDYRSFMHLPAMVEQLSIVAICQPLRLQNCMVFQQQENLRYIYLHFDSVTALNHRVLCKADYTQGLVLTPVMHVNVLLIQVPISVLRFFPAGCPFVLFP